MTNSHEMSTLLGHVGQEGGVITSCLQWISIFWPSIGLHSKC